MTPRGLVKLTAIVNNMQAWHDWQLVANAASEQGHGALVAQYLPPHDAGWRKVDKARHALEAAIRGTDDHTKET